MMILPSPSPAPAPIRCDVCQSRTAIVTLGCVDYCALCAPLWHPSFGPTDEELDAVVEEAVAIAVEAFA